jgi:lysyl-tRNA synthetase, class I
MTEYTLIMFWGDKITEKIKSSFKEKIEKGEAIIIRDEKTASGRVHVGSLRGVAIHGVIHEILQEQGINCKYLYEINDYDPMDGLPVYLDQEKFLPYMGKPLAEVPSPDGQIKNGAKNYAEYFAEEFMGVINTLGYTPEYYRSSELYKTGKFNETIRLALLNANKIREIYKRVSGGTKPDDWLPLNVICENCGKVGTTKAVKFENEKVEYICGDYVTWAKGCGYKGSVSPYDGKAKLPWKVEWAAKFKVIGVDVEGGGKDHSTRGGAREIAEAISREVFNHQPPFNIPYEFFQVGGKKMSSSKGAGSSSKEVSDLLPSEILRLLLIQKEPQRVIEFVPDGDTVPILYDNYDTLAKKYFEDSKNDNAHLFELCHFGDQRKKMQNRVLPRFAQLAYLVQMPHLNLIKEVEKLEGKELNDVDIKELEHRKKYAEIWLSTYAPEDYKFEIQKTLPGIVKNFSTIQKEALRKVLEFIESSETLDGQILHTKLHDIKKEMNIDPKEFFEALYISILGKGNGPKAGWFFSVLDRDFLIKRLKEATL